MKNLKKLVAKLSVVALLTVTLFSSTMFADNTEYDLINLSDDISDHQSQAEADHNINFSVDGDDPILIDGDGTSDTIKVTFAPEFGIPADVTTDEVSLAIDGNPQTTCTTGGNNCAASSGSWGVDIFGQVVTLTTPDDASTTVIGSNNNVTIDIATAINPNIDPENSKSYRIELELDSNDGTTSYGAIAVTINEGTVTMDAYVLPHLTMELSDTDIDLGDIDVATTGSDSLTLTVDTNTRTGYTVSYESTDLYHKDYDDQNPDASLVLDSYTDGNANGRHYGDESTPGEEGWGINIMSNSTPSIGADVVDDTNDDTGELTPESRYGTADQYSVDRSGSEEQLVTSDGTANDHVITVSYVMNVDPATPAGGFEGEMNFFVFGNF